MIKNAILTGASDGIGKALAFSLARRSFSLGLIARREELLKSVREECLKLGSPEVWIERVDVTDEAGFESALNSLDSKLNGCELFIANAGVGDRSVATQASWPSVKNTFLVNTFGAIHGLEHMKVKMLARGTGILCGISSVAGARGMPTGGAYSSSKAALTTHLETLRIDLKDAGISVVTVAPGFINVGLALKNKGKLPFLMDVTKASEVFVEKILKRKSFVVAPLPFRILYPIIQMLPNFLFDALAKRLYKRIR